MRQPADLPTLSCHQEHFPAENALSWKLPGTGLRSGWHLDPQHLGQDRAHQGASTSGAAADGSVVQLLPHPSSHLLSPCWTED